MKKQLFFLLIVLALTIGMAVPTGTAAASGAKQVDFSVSSSSLCPGDPTLNHPLCNPGTVEPLPSGVNLVTGYVEVMDFHDASDPRWNAICVFSAKPFQFNPLETRAFPIMGSFECTAKDPAYQGAMWKGNLQQVAQMDSKWVHVWTADGYGAFEGLKTITYNTVSSKYEGFPPGTNVGVIIELPGYQK